MVRLLVDAGADVNAGMPGVTFADGYGYGGIKPLMCARMHASTTQLLLDLGASSSKTACCPGYTEIPFPNHDALQLAGTDAVAHVLVAAGANVNNAASVSSCYHLSSVPVNGFWLSIVDIGDTAWAAQLFQVSGADPNWPRCIAGFSGDDLGLHCSWPWRWRGLGATVLITAILRRHFPMVELLLLHCADPNLPEYARLVGELGNEVLDDAREMEGTYSHDAQRATPLSVALGFLRFGPPEGGLQPLRKRSLGGMLPTSAPCAIRPTKAEIAGDAIALVANGAVADGRQCIAPLLLNPPAGT